MTMKKTIGYSLLIALCVAFAPPLLGSAEAKKTCLVNKFHYENRSGGYKVSDLTVHRKNYSHNRGGIIYGNESRTLEIKHSAWDPEKPDKAGIKENQEIWLTFKIMGLKVGDKRRSCRKDDTKLVYHPQGNTWTFWSKGTTEQNNRCHFGNNDCMTLQELYQR